MNPLISKVLLKNNFYKAIIYFSDSCFIGLSLQASVNQGPEHLSHSLRGPRPSSGGWEVQGAGGESSSDCSGNNPLPAPVGGPGPLGGLRTLHQWPQGHCVRYSRFWSTLTRPPETDTIKTPPHYSLDFSLATYCTRKVETGSQNRCILLRTPKKLVYNCYIYKYLTWSATIFTTNF